MANDPNRDLLPVKESSERGSCEFIDPHFVSRFKRSELEDRYIKLYEENNELKKLTNIQEGKIKKLGTKLLRVLEDKKLAPYGGRRNEGVDEDLQSKVIELEHENYALRDKNTVLRQQLASHSRQHMAAHRSPVRLGTTPRLSQRQASVPNINEGSYTLSNRRNSTEMQLRDAEAHISALNEEIKHLHSQIESLQHEHEKISLKAQQAQVSENIDLIKQKRHNKNLESQIKMLEQTHKALQQDMARLQKENEEALQIVNAKQKEILDIQTKLDEALQLKFDVKHLKTKVADLTRERDILQERCDSLMKSVSEKNSEEKVHSTLQKELSQVKADSVLLRQELDILKEQNLHLAATCGMRTLEHGTQTEGHIQGRGGKNASRKSSLLEEFDFINEAEPFDILKSLAKYRTMGESIPKEVRNDGIPPSRPGTSESKDFSVPTSQARSTVPSDENKNDAANLMAGVDVAWLPRVQQEDLDKTLSTAAERIELRRELDSLRDMMKVQSQRCDEQENEIKLMQQEMKLKEERYKDVCQQRDLFLRLFENGALKKDSPKPNLSNKATSKASSECSESGEIQPSNKNAGTYTKNSPTEVLSKANSLVHLEPEVVILPTPAKPAEFDKKDERSAPVPIPRVSSAKAKTPLVDNPTVPEPIEIKVLIMWLTLDEGSRILENENIVSLYIDFTFLSTTNEAFETPKALPKPKKAQSKVVYNYEADVPWTEDLLEPLKKAHAKNGDVIVFNIVSEPEAGDDEEGQGEIHCLVVGVTAISFHQFAFVDPDSFFTLPIYEVGKERKQCGTLAVKLILSPSVFGEIQKCVS